MKSVVFRQKKNDPQQYRGFVADSSRTKAKLQIIGRNQQVCFRKAGTLVVVILLSVFCLICGIQAEPAFAAEGYEDVAGSSEMSKMKDVDKYGMTPIYGESVKDGTYDVKVKSSSSFFRVYACRLTVKGSRMTAVITIDSTSYECVFMGKAEDAAKAPKSKYIFAEVKDGQSRFTIPAAALNKPLACAAFSKKEKQWYDRNLLIDASSLPEGALAFELPDYDLIEKAVDQYEKDNGSNGGEAENSDGSGSGDGTTGNGNETTGSGDSAEKNGDGQNGTGQDSFNALIPADVDMEDGTYSIEVNMIGGSGRASVSSPTWFFVKNGKAYAKLLWSSSHYDYMKIMGVKFENQSKDGGNSTFTIPVAAFDQPIRVIADTTAMGDPVEIEYELTFYRDTINSVTKVPQEAAKRVIAIALIIIIVGGILNIILKRRKKQ